MIDIIDVYYSGTDSKPYHNNQPIIKTAAFAVAANKFDIRSKLYSLSNHNTNSSFKYKSASNRRDRVKSLKLCSNCLRSNHSISKCSNPGGVRQVDANIIQYIALQR